MTNSNRIRSRKWVRLLAVGSLSVLMAPVHAADTKPLVVNIKMVDGLRFEPPRFEAPPGSEVVVKLENADTTHQIHNFLVTAPGKRMDVVQAALELGDQGEARGHVPDTPLVLAHSPLVLPDETAEVRFTLPKTKGIFPFVCTFPGHGFVMYGAVYAGEKMPPLAKDANIPPNVAEAAIAGGGRRPFVQRMFLPDSGPAAIAVALPGDLNYCWDAGSCRLRYVWKGAFLDASKYWAGNGNALAHPLGLSVWRAPSGTSSFTVPCSFLGYKLAGGIPEFRYRVGGVEVAESLAPEGTGHLRVTYAVVSATGSVQLRGPGPDATGTAGPIPPGGVKLAAGKPISFTLNFAGVP